MKNNLTELVFILDRSGSMHGLEGDTIGGFNSLIDKQRKEDGECFVTTILFDSELETLHDRVELGTLKDLTDEDYTVGGCTALIDAIGTTIKHIKDVHKYIRAEDVPEKTLFVIMTDGMENASHIFSSKKVKKMIEAQKELGWEFLFIGANIDAVETAKSFGIREDRAVNYHADAKGTSVAYEAVSKAVGAVRCRRPLRADWSAEIADDYDSRK